MSEYDKTPENGGENCKEKKQIIIVLVIIVILVMILFAAVGSLFCKYVQGWTESVEKQNPSVLPTVTVMSTATPTATSTPLPERKKITPLPTPTPTPEAKYENIDPYLEERLAEIEKKEALAVLLGTPYDGIWPMTDESMSCIVKKDGKWGMALVTGEVLVEPKYERFSFLDNTGWVEFEENGQFYVYDEQGTLVRQYADKTVFRMESEEAYLFRTAKAYMSGMEITFTIPEISGDDYYGVEYRNKATGELLYSAVGGYEDVGLFTYPDETGRAVAIRCDGLANTIYYITKEGCESRVMELPEGVNTRWIDFVGNYTWADISLSQGWLKVYVSDAKPGFLIERYHNYYAFLNVDTLELVPFPEEYQKYFVVYNRGYGDTMAIRLDTEDGANDKYAICKGDRVLTPEQYYWVDFAGDYMVAYRDDGMDVLDYNGTVKGTYWDVSGFFINGRMLVLDEAGLYFIDEQFEQCSEFFLKDWEVDGCFARGAIVDNQYYFLKEFAMEELPKNEAGSGISKETVIPEPTGVPVKLTEEAYEVVETTYDVFRYLEDVYIIRNGNYYGMADLKGNVLVEPVYNKWVYSDQDWISFENADQVTFVFDRSGNRLYSYVCNEGVKITESGQQFNRAVFYRQGMKIEFDYNEDNRYYGIHFYNAESGELIFELTDEMQGRAENPQPDVLVTSMPDESGTAVVIAGDGFENTMYKITKDGYTEEKRREYFVERRFFNFSSHDVWNRTNLIDGWLLTTVLEERGELLDYSEEWTDILYNIHTGERVPLPKNYQDWFGEYYQHSEGIYYGMSGESLYDYYNSETDCVYYAVCHGNKQLTEELYQWIRFDETYIIAGNESFSHILDYEGNVLAEYRDVAFPFVDGKTLVCDEKGAFYIDEKLQRCSEYVMEDVDYCHPNFLRKGDRFYLVKWNKTEE